MGRQKHVQLDRVSSSIGPLTSLPVPLEQGPGALQVSKLPEFPAGFAGPGPLQLSKLPEFPAGFAAGQLGANCNVDESRQSAGNAVEQSTQSLMRSLQQQLKEHSELIKHLLEVSGPIFEARAVGTQAASSRMELKAVDCNGSFNMVDCMTKSSEESSRKSHSVFHSWAGQKNDQKSEHMQIRLESKPAAVASSTRSMARLVKSVWHRVQTRTHAWFEEQDSLVLEGTSGRNISEHTWSARFERAVQSHYFNSVAMTLIGLNAVLIGWQADQQMQCLRKNPNSFPEPSEALEQVADVFSIAFAVELAIRIAALRARFIFTPDIKWNMLDTLLVASGIIEMIVDSSGKQLSFARVLRILRMVRVLRIIRMVRFFDSLRKMVGALMNSLLSLFWLVVLLFIVLFVFAVGCMQAIAQHLEGYSEDTASPEQQKQYKDFMNIHGGLLKSMLSLLETISDGTGWHIVMGPVMDISWIYGIATVVFVFFTIFGVMNVVTGIFVDRALYISQLDRNVMIRDEMDRNHVYIRELKNAFITCDRNGDGTLTREEVKLMLEKPQIQAMFRMLQLSVSDAGQLEQLWDLLDPEETGCVAIDDFVQACLRLKGVASSLDLCALLLEVSFMRDFMEDLRVELAGRFDMVFTRLDCLMPPSMHPYLVKSKSDSSVMTVRKRERRFKLPTLSNDALIVSSMHLASPLSMRS